MLLILYPLLDQAGAYSVQIVQVLPSLGRCQDDNPAVRVCYFRFSGQAFELLIFGLGKHLGGEVSQNFPYFLHTEMAN